MLFFRRRRWLCLLILYPATARGQTAPPPPSSEEITVIGTSPLLGSGIDRDQVPGQTAVLGAKDIARDGTPDLLHALDTQVAGVNLDSASGNQFQPALFYNGFEASPLQGTSQGIAVYVNGVRFNQAFGDTVNWDLIPDQAIDRLNVEGANPVFGLNALGGSVNARLKTGFSYQGAEADVSGGSFGQVQGEFQYGKRQGDAALYVAGTELHQDGWRDLQSSDIQNFFADAGWRGSDGELHLGLTLANSVLNGPGTAPVELISADPRAQFTAPNLIANKTAQLSLSAVKRFSDTVSVQALAFGGYFLQRVVNGNTANDAPCDDGSGLLCSAPGVPSTTRGGIPITDFLHGGPYSELDEQTTNTVSYGGSIQATDTGDLWGLANHAVAGISFDGAQTEFSALGLIGGLSPVTRIFLGPGVTIDEPGNNTPVRVAVTDAYVGAYASDTLDLTRSVALTVSGRFNNAEIDLADQGGGDLSGHHAYSSFNPAAGLTWKATSWLTLYGGGAQANRAPTPAELSCAGPSDACSLANFFVGDPDLKQVVARTIEAGARGHLTLPGRIAATYSLGLFRTESEDDIAFINSPVLGRAYFANIGPTRRQGLSALVDFKRGVWSVHAAYTHTEATFRAGFVESAGSNPAGDADGNLTIRPGASLPGIPKDVFKAGGDVAITPSWTAGLEAVHQSSQELFGDEANLTPPLPGFFRLDLHTAYQLTPHWQVFASVQNATDARIYTFGTFSPTSSVFLAQAPHATDPRSYSLAAPVGAFGGVRVTF
jgi:outer membrane receptor protein involved in Fe transport